MGLPSWYEIEESDEFKASDDKQKDAYRNQYFDESVAADDTLSSRSSEEIEGARTGWLQSIMPPPPSDEGFLGNIKNI